LASRAAERRLRSPRRDPQRRDADGRVVILLLHAYGIGGAIRSVFNLAAELARTREVEIVSVVRIWDEPLLPLPAGVRVTWLDERRPSRGTLLSRALSSVPSVLMHPDDDFASWFTVCAWPALRAG
jgi:hypothetical protein